MFAWWKSVVRFWLKLKRERAIVFFKLSDSFFEFSFFHSYAAFLSPLIIVPNCNKILHLENKWTIRLAKMRVLIFCCFHVCVFVNSFGILFTSVNNRCRFKCSLSPCLFQFSFCRYADIILFLFSNSQRYRKDCDIYICLLLANHYLTSRRT